MAVLQVRQCSSRILKRSLREAPKGRSRLALLLEKPTQYGSTDLCAAAQCTRKSCYSRQPPRWYCQIVYFAISLIDAALQHHSFAAASALADAAAWSDKELILIGSSTFAICVCFEWQAIGRSKHEKSKRSKRVGDERTTSIQQAEHCGRSLPCLNWQPARSKTIRNITS
jgi:hypothetical protein